MFFPKESAWDVMHERVHCHDEAANYQLPTAATFWVVQIVSAEEWSSLTQNLMQVHCCASSVILNATATQHTISLNRIYHTHWLVEWNHHCSLMSIPVHSPWSYESFKICLPNIKSLLLVSARLKFQVLNMLFICFYIYTKLHY